MIKSAIKFYNTLRKCGQELSEELAYQYIYKLTLYQKLHYYTKNYTLIHYVENKLQSSYSVNY